MHTGDGAEGSGAAGVRPKAVLVGPPGSGKTSVGAALAALTGLAVRDTDADVEATVGMTIAELFATRGEPAFRELEEQAVAAGLAEHAGVLSLGGGAVLSDRTRAALRGHAVVFLATSASVGMKRVGLTSHRPLLAGINPRATYRSLLAQRLPLYQEVAAVEIDTDGLTVGQVAAAIAERLGLGSA
ncbi:shikimate kinase [Nakamurella leprariae]|uniref:Shikimate kinase n=1 Tax=Nakamurella leprariae TaxID=2803911 RepID=A0A938Y9D6_9ACTN|nr:shikimate kinase [Nakamurella leprariae]MBM9468270.1 shikimate kinase [Nakamurella leprariae]